MKIERLGREDVGRLGGPAGVAAALRARVPDGDSVEEDVREIIAAVRDGGEEAVREYTRRFDTAGAEPRALTVAPQELDEAIKRMPLDVVAGLQVAIANVAIVAQAGVSEDVAVDLPQGQRVTMRELPVGSAAVYVPGGRAPYPSTVVMGVVTARAAGVVDVAVCAPPGADGEIDRTILGACRLCGVERVHRMGGAQAIAALAHGTETVDRVDVIVGPGNLYVQEAKRQLSGIVGIDGFAGPSDLMVVLGAEVGERERRLAAMDMLAQAEHGQGSLVVAVCSDGEVLNGMVRTLVELSGGRQAFDGGSGRPQVSGGEVSGECRASGGEGFVGRKASDGAVFVLVEVDDDRQAVAVANAFAPEHLELIGAQVEALAPTVRSAGCVFVGASAATAFGDYVAGSNHVLPTGGSARFASTLSARHFRRRMAEVRIGAAAEKLAAAGAPIARAEGFEVHAESMEARALDPGAGLS